MSSDFSMIEAAYWTSVFFMTVTWASIGTDSSKPIYAKGLFVAVGIHLVVIVIR